VTTTIQRVIEVDIPIQMLSYSTVDTKGKKVSFDNWISRTTWDKIFITLLEKLKLIDGIHATRYKRKFWDMLLIHDTVNKVLLTLMREKTLKTVLKELQKGSLHYLGSMVREFNNHLVPQQLPLDGLEIVSDNQEYSDKLCIQQILDALQEQSADKISEVVTVRFSSFNNVLRSISAVQIDNSYNIVKESNWIAQLEVGESLIQETAEIADVPAPIKRVNLTAKALERQQRSG